MISGKVLVLVTAAPTFTADAGTFAFDTVAKKLYVNEDGGTTWQDLSAAGGAGTNFDSFRFVGSGSLAAQTGLDGAWVADRAGTFKSVTLHRVTAGGSGSTIVDVNKDATTIFTTQANRPTVTSAQGDGATDKAANMDVTAFVDGSIITVDVDSAETGPSKDLSVTIVVEY